MSAQQLWLVGRVAVNCVVEVFAWRAVRGRLVLAFGVFGSFRPSRISSWAEDWRRSMADCARSGSVMSPSHSHESEPLTWVHG